MREVYIRANSKEEANRINDMNDSKAKATLRSRDEQLRKNGQMNEWDFDDMKESLPVAKLFTTCFIGNVAIFEEEFGFLWGHGKNYYDLNKSERFWREIWNTARRRIMDHSNNLMRESL